MTEEWTCPTCGAPNERKIGEKKVCSTCGHNEEYYELPEDDGSARGYM